MEYTDYELYQLLEENGYKTTEKNLQILREGLDSGKYKILDEARHENKIENLQAVIDNPNSTSGQRRAATDIKNNSEAGNELGRKIAAGEIDPRSAAKKIINLKKEKANIRKNIGKSASRFNPTNNTAYQQSIINHNAAGEQIKRLANIRKNKK